jgi:hypothetical protein
MRDASARLPFQIDSLDASDLQVESDVLGF